MIRKNSLLCKLIRIKTSSKFIFDSFMAQFRPELETCPVCNTTGQCHIHAYYGRSINDFCNGSVKKDNLCILRVLCSSCNHPHAVLPDFIIPYSSYSILFILRVLGEFFAHLHTVEQICERFNISLKQFHKWLTLWHSHKQEWLGILADAETNDLMFLKQLIFSEQYSSLLMAFFLRSSYSFMQSHKNPVLKRPANARYHQHIFSPDYSLW